MPTLRSDGIHSGCGCSVKGASNFVDNFGAFYGYLAIVFRVSKVFSKPVDFLNAYGEGGMVSGKAKLFLLLRAMRGSPFNQKCGCISEDGAKERPQQNKTKKAATVLKSLFPSTGK